MEIPAAYRSSLPENVMVGNVARNYTKMVQDLRQGTHSAPNFEDAVAIHRIIAAIEQSAEDGQRTRATRLPDMAEAL